MKTYLLVDGGGSKTSVRLIEMESGRQVFESIGGPGNLGLGAASVWGTITDLLVDCPFQPDAFVCGLAGSEYESERSEFLAFAQKRTIVVSDSDSGLLGSHGNQPGSSLTVGTGVALSWMDHAHIVHCRGGFGFMLGDEGGGAWLGLRALRDLALVGRTNTITSEQSDLLAEFQIGSNFVDWIEFANQATPQQFAKLAKPLVDACLTNSWAQSVLNRGCDHLLSLLKASPADLPVSLVGGLSSIYRKLFRARGIDTVNAKGDALDGLAFLAHHQDVTKIQKWVSHE